MEAGNLVLITGSSGFIGSELAKALVKDHTVVGLDQTAPVEKIPGVDHYDLNITSEEDIRRTLIAIKEKYGKQVRSVIHLISFYDFRGQEDKRYQTITINGTKFFLQQLRENFEVEKFIFSSSLLVYAPVPIGEKITDDSDLAPAWPYPRSKVETEKIMREEQGNISVLNLRIAGVYDDFCRSPTISQQIIRIHEGWPSSVLFPGNPNSGQTFIHVKDLSEVMCLLVKTDKNLGPFVTFVLGEEKVMSFKELQNKLGMLLYLTPWPTVRIPKFIARTGAKVMQRLPFIREPFIRPWMVEHADEHFDVDIGKLKRTINWNPTRSLESTLPVIVENLKRSPREWYQLNKVVSPFYRDLSMINGPGEKNMYFASIINVFLGLLLMANPFSFGKLETGEHISQIITGILVALLGCLSLVPTIRWVRWINALVGCWALFSPLVFHTTSAAAYSNDTLIGALIILASAYTPSAANDLAAPPGWSYNPSTASQRIPIMLLAFTGYLASRYLAAYQLGHIENVWDPFFGNASERILTSSISKAFPISDAGLGALTYLLDVVAASIGGRDRWRGLPWAVIFFGLMIIPSGITSITLVMLQPIGVGAWCTVCLFTAIVMLLMVPPAVDEVMASVQFLWRRKKAGDSFWRVFWLGQSRQEEIEVTAPPAKHEGKTYPLYLCLALSTWLMLSPWYFSMEDPASSSAYIVASLAITFSVIALSEVARPLRLVNVPLGLWLALSGWLLAGMNMSARWHNVVVGILILVLSLPRGKRKHTFGEMDHFVHWTPSRR